MQTLSLHSIKSQRNQLKYILVFALLLSIGLNVLAKLHDSEHMLKPDQHCSMCTSSFNLEHSLPLNQPKIYPPLFVNVTVNTTSVEHVGVLTFFSGNRDPPKLNRS